MLSLSSRELDFGLLHYSPEIAPVTRVFEIKNLDLTRNIIVDIENSRKLSNDFPVIVSIFEVDDDIDINDLNLMHRFFDANISTSSNTKERTIITLKPLQSKQVVTVMSPYFFDRTSPDFLNTYARTSFSKVILKVTLQYSILIEYVNNDIKNIDDIEDININKDNEITSDKKDINIINECKGETDITISAMICTSILYADETDIEFDSCIVGNTYMRDIQIWNRSECPLLYRLSPLLGMVKDLPSISFQEFETGRQLNFDRTIVVPAFASKRIRLVFKAEELGASHFVFRLENINNPTNTSILNCRVNVIVKEESDNLLVELETGTILGSGQVLELGDCYCGLVVYRRIWLKNTGKDSLTLTASTDNPSEVSFDISGQIPSQLEESDQLQDTTGKKKEHLLANLQSNASKSLSIIPNNDSSSNNNLIKNSKQQIQQSDDNNWLFSKRMSNIRQSDAQATWGGSGTRERDLASICGLSFGDTWIDENDDDDNKYNSEEYRLFNKSQSKRDKNLSTIYNKQFDEEQGTKKFLSSYGKNYYSHNDFSESLSLSFAEKSSIVQSIDRRNEKNITQYENDKNINSSSSNSSSSSSSSSSSVSSNINNIIKSKNGKSEPILLSPGMTKPITLLFCPNVDITSSSSGSLLSKTIKLFLSWKVKTKIDPRIFESDNELKNATVNKTDTSTFTVARYSRKIVCKARTCMSIVSIQPKINDLGECSVGEFRGAFFTLTNDSDLPAVILPVIESESISISEKEIKIPPRQRRKITMEYVARCENTDYKKEALLLNAFNSHGNVTVEVRAKNVDTHQVLYHSLFYKLSTHNKKRQMQVYFDKCLYNMPNLRMFSIRNIHTEPLLLELLPSDPDVSIFLIIQSSSSFHNGIIKDNKLINNNENKLISGESQERSKHIEDLKWGTPLPLLAPIRRAGSFHEETFSANERDNPSIPLNSSNQSSQSTVTIDPVPMTRLIRSGSETSFDSLLKSKQSTSNTIAISTVPNSTSSSLFHLNKGGYPFSLIQNNSSLINNNEVIEIEKKNSDNKDVKVDDEDEEVQEEEEDEDHVKDSLNLSVISGNNNGSTISTIGSNIDGINDDKNNSIIDEHEAIKTTIKIIQNSYRDVKDIIVKKEGIISIGRDQTETILIPSGKSFNFVVVFQPKSEDNKKELEEVILHRSVKLKLLSVNSGDVMSQVFQNGQSNDDIYISPNQKHTVEPLKPRTLLIRAKTTRSEMVVLQKNISFGRSVVGETSTRGVTIVNRSDVPCMYSISKSGNIASGYLKIPSGREGYIAPLTSQSIDFVFKPTLSGNFEETVIIENILEPSNTQSIVIKAKVSKPESFKILPFPSSINPINTFAPTDISLDENNLSSNSGVSNQINQITPPLSINSLTPSKIKEEFKSLQDIPENDLENRYKYQLNRSLSRVDVKEGTTITPFFLGKSTVGESSETAISFRIRNVTSKPRTFIVDATQADAVSLFISPTNPQIVNSNNSTGELIDENSNHISDDLTDFNDSSPSKLNCYSPTPILVLPTPFEPITETLQSIVRLSCKFEDLNFNVVEDTLSTEQREILGDKLEHYNQKLKIAYRKNKPEKISKYEKKVSETKSILSGEKSIFDVDVDGDSDKEKDTKEDKKKNKKDKKDKKDKDINENVRMKDKDVDNDVIKVKDVIIDSNEIIVEQKELSNPQEDIEKKLSLINVDDIDKKIHTTMKMAWDDTAIIDGGNTNSPMKPTFLLSSPRIIDSDSAFHVHIGSEQEVSIQIKFTFFPGQSYNSWEGLLPFKGYLRVFECKNEDLIKTIEFGAMLYSSKINASSKLVDDEDFNLKLSPANFKSRSKDELDSRLRANAPEPKMQSPLTKHFDEVVSSTNRSSNLKHNDKLLSGFDGYDSPKKAESPIDNNNSNSPRGSNKNVLVRTHSLDDFSQLEYGNDQVNLKSFFPTIAQWSNIPTNQIYPRYDQHPKRVLGVSLKLVYTKYAFVGALSISSLLPEDATLRLSIIDNFDIHVNRNLDYKLYSPNDHGPISFLTGGTVSIGFGGTGHTTKLTSQVISTQSLTPLPTSSSDIKESEITSTVTSVPIVAEASSLEKYNRSNGSMLAKMPPHGNVECILEWKLKKEMQKQSVLIAGMLSVQMIVKEKIIGVTQYIPVVFYVDHKSSIKCDKFCNLGEVPLGSTKSITITIFNQSEDGELHYTIVASAPPKALSVVGRVNISSGRTGVILPSSSKEFKMDFNATSIGKFEQQLWISNLRDQFDQKLIAFTASVTVAQSLFVLFPDLESDGTDKVQKLDFGLIQIKSLEESNHLNNPLDLTRGNSTPSPYINLTSINDFRYKLRLQNVSKLPLLVTAVSNLRSQCFIFTDEACTQPVVSLLMPQSEETILHIVIRPSSQTSNQWTSSSKNVNNINGNNENIKDNNKSNLTAQHADTRNERLFGRELVGGIRLVFFTVEQSQTPSVVPAEDLTLGNQSHSISTTPSIIDTSARKLFETTVVFKAIVGSSLLKIRNLSPKMFVVNTKDKFDKDSDLSLVKGNFLIENLSSTFPLMYQYIDTHCECEDKSGECLIDSGQEIDRKFVIFDSNEGNLSPGESKTISYGIRYKNTISGLMQITLKVLNINTKDIQTLELSVFFDKGQVRTVDMSIKPPPLVSIDVNSANSVVTSPLSGPIWLSLATCNSIFTSQQHLSRPSSSIQKSSANIQIDKNPTLLSNDQNIPSIRTSYHVIGSNEVYLCSWVVENTLSHPIVLSPVSDFPVTVIFETIDNSSRQISEQSNSISSDISGGRRDRAHSFDSMTTNKRGFNSCPSVSTPSASGNSSLFSDTPVADVKFIKCGESTSISPGKSRRVVVQCKYGAELSSELLSSLSSSAAALNNGSIGRSTGIVAFMWTSVGDISTRDLPSKISNNKNNNISIRRTSPLLSMFENTTDEIEQMKGTNINKPPLSLVTMFTDIPQSISDDELTSIDKLKNKNINIIEKSPQHTNNLSELYPVIGYTQLQCDFVIPRISVTRSQYDLGSIRSGQKISFSISINNNCDATLPIAIEDLPIWMTIEDIDNNNNIENTNEAFIESNNYNSKNNNSLSGSLFSIPARSTLALQAKILGPKIDAQIIDHALTIRNLALSSHVSRKLGPESGSSSDTDSETFNNHLLKFIGEEFIDVRIILEIEITEAIVLVDTQKDSKGRSFIECSDTLIVPSPVQSYDEDVVIEELPLPVNIDNLNLPIMSPLSMHGVKNMNKTARISIKNKTKKILSVAITTEVFKELKDVVGFRVLGSNNNFELQSKETTEFRVLIESLRGGRIQPVLPPISSIELQDVVDTSSEVVIIPSISKLNNNLINDNSNNTSLVISNNNNNSNNNRNRDQLNTTPTQQNSSSSLSSITESGRIYFGTIIFQPSIKRYVNSGSLHESVVEIDNLQGDIIREDVTEDTHFLDELSFDVYGFLEAGPTHSIARISTSPTETNTTNASIVSGSGEVSESILVFQAVNNKSSQPLSIPSKRDDNTGEGIRSPKLKLKDETLLVRLSNYSATKNLSYRSTSVPHRHSGMRLIFTGGVTNDRNYNDDDGFYDTVIARIYPPTGLIPPLSSIIVGIRIEPCTSDDINPDIPIVVTKQDRNPEVDGLMTIMQMPLSIWDDLSPLHPPIILDVFLRSDVLLPIIFSQPVSHTNRKKTHLNSYHDGHEIVRDKERGSFNTNENNSNLNSNTVENVDGDSTRISNITSTEKRLNSNVIKRKNKTSSSTLPLIRIRGVTPCDGGLFEISLGQQMKRAESIEWQIELENCSDIDTIKFRICSLSSCDDTWLLLSQTKGIITPESGSTSISAYFSQHIVGKFFSYIIVENIIDSFRRHIQILRVSMNVIETIQCGSSSLQNEQIKISRSESVDFSEDSDINVNLNLINNSNKLDELQLKILDPPSKSSKLNQYSTLESSIVSFINLYNLFWADMIDFSNSLSSSVEMDSTNVNNNNNNNKDATPTPKNNKLSSIQSAFEILLNASDNLVITDEMILYKNNNRSDLMNQINDDIIDDSDKDQSQSQIDAFACRLASVFLQFFALTDQLTLLALKEYSSSTALAALEKTLTSMEMSQSTTYLAHLLYFIVFKHPVFEYFLDNSFNNNSNVISSSASSNLEEEMTKNIINNEDIEIVNNKEEILPKSSAMDYLKNKLMKPKKDGNIPQTPVIIDFKSISPIDNSTTSISNNNNINQNILLPVVLLPFVKRFTHYMQFGYLSIETISDRNVSDDLYDLLKKLNQEN
jgi:hypothetical protein